MARLEIENIIRCFLVEDLEFEEEKIFDNAKLKNDIGINIFDFVSHIERLIPLKVK